MPALKCKCDKKQESFHQKHLDKTELRYVFGMRLKILTVVLLSPLVLIVQQSFSQSSVYSDQECLSCHGKPEIAQIMSDGKVRSLYVDPEEWNQDIHHTGSMLCVDCHTHANPYIHFREGFIDVDCSRCHPEEAEEYQKNIHATFAAPSPGKELPLCFHCHTKHYVLHHDDPASSVSEINIGDTCGACHAEVMVKGVIKGSSLGKISGHRKGDISERFDIRVCISCHYEDSAHGAKRVYKDFCSRCHDVGSMANIILGTTHLNSQRVSSLNYLSSALVLSFVFGVCIFLGYRSRGRIVNGVKSWLDGMTIQLEDKPPEDEVEDNEKEGTGLEIQPEHATEETGKEDTEPQQEDAEEQASEEESPQQKQTEDADHNLGGKQEPGPDDGKKEDQNLEQETAEEEDQAEQMDKEEPSQEETQNPEDNNDGGERET